MPIKFQRPIWDWPAFSGNPTTFTLNTGVDYAASAKVAATYWFPAGKTIAAIGVYCTAATTPPVLQARVETNGGTAGASPTGTLVAAGASGTFTPAAATYHVVNLSTPYTVAAGGQTLSLVIGLSSGAWGSVTVYSREPAFSRLTAWPSTYNGTTWTTTTGQIGYLIPIDENGDPMFDRFALTPVTQAVLSYASNSNPNEHGSRILANFPFLANGMLIRTRLQPSTGLIARFWHNGTQISTDAECTLAAGQTQSSATVDFISIPLATPRYVEKGDEIVISLQANTATSGALFYTQQFLASAFADTFRDGRTWERVTRNGGAFSSAGQPLQIPLALPTIDPLYRTALRRHPGMKGGFSA